KAPRNDPGSSPNPPSGEDKAELSDIVEAATIELTSAGRSARLDAIGIANAQLRNMFEIDAHPQLKERNRWREVTTSNGQTARTLLPPSMPVGMEPRWEKVPALGEHTESVLAEFGIKEYVSVTRS